MSHPGYLAKRALDVVLGGAALLVLGAPARGRRR